MDHIVFTSKDGTKKIVFKDGYTSVIIPTKDEKYAVCVSCQLGCPVGCTFCHTGKMGLKRNLSVHEIVEQVSVAKELIGKLKIDNVNLSPDEQARLGNPTTVVFMGMGEPLLNFHAVLIAAEEIHKKFLLAYRRITISTSCLNTINKLLDVPFNVALSVHSPFDDIRMKLMPASIPINDVLIFANEYAKKNPNKELMIEYALIKGVNDRDEDMEKLASLSWPKIALFNFIQYNELDAFKRSDDDRLHAFKKAMIDAGFKSFVRISRGDDIDAACGMLDFTEKIIKVVRK